MIRTSSESATGVQDRTIGETTAVAVLASVGLLAGTVGAAAAWDAIGAVPIVGHMIAIAAGIALAVGLPALLGRTVARALPTRRRSGDVDASARSVR